MELSEASRYSDLLGHIYLHKSVLEHKKGLPVTIEEAAADWYDNVFRPAVTLIRKYEILEHMPERTEADLFLWLVDHLREVRDELGEKAESRIEHPDCNIVRELHGGVGDVGRGFDEADVVCEGTFETTRAQHAHFETHCSIAWLEDDRLHVRTSSQLPVSLTNFRSTFG